MSEQAELRQGRVEGILEQVVARLDSMEMAHRQDIAALRQDMRQDITDINRRLVGILFGVASAQIADIELTLLSRC